jgi:hypothetical protein
VLTAASWHIDDGAYLVLAFDRDIVFPGGLPDSFVLLDGGTSSRYGGMSGSLIDPHTARVDMTFEDSQPSGGVTLYCNSANGIASASDGAMWEGVVDLELPWP